MRITAWRTFLALALLASLAAASPPAGAQTTGFATEHFSVRYSPMTLTEAEARETAQLAEAAYRRCLSILGESPRGMLELDLAPDFTGATGYTSRRRNGPIRIGLRYADLDYLGLTPEYVITHEVAHAFTYALAGSPLGEGIADCLTAQFADLKMARWWGPTLERAGLWVEPRALFVTGDYAVSGEVDARVRTAQYAEAGLLVKFLVERVGWAPFLRFANQYGEGRRTLLSNSDPSGAPERWGREVQPPDIGRIEAAFRQFFGATSDQVLREWREWLIEGAREMPPPPNEARKLVLAHEVYGAIRNYEGWLLREQVELPAEQHQRIRGAFTATNRALAAGDLAEARRRLETATALVSHARRPPMIAGLPLCGISQGRQRARG